MPCLTVKCIECAQSELAVGYFLREPIIFTRCMFIEPYEAKDNLSTVCYSQWLYHPAVFIYFSFKIINAYLISVLLPIGKATGLVTNTRVTHATPAALFAHSPSRYWEDDGKVTPGVRSTCKDIARQLVEDEPGRHINVSA